MDADTSPIAAAREHLAAGRLPQAEEGFRAALAADASNAQAVAGMGEVALEAGQPLAAIEFLEIALSLDPDLPMGRVLLGVALLRIGRGDEAQALFEEAIARRPANAMAHYWLGHHLIASGDNAAGFTSIGEAMRLYPDLVSKMSLSLYDQLQDCDWRGWDEMKALLEAAALEGRGLSDPLTLMMLSDSPAAILAATRTYTQRHYPARAALRTGPNAPGKRIRLGFFSADLHDHPVGHLIAGVLENLDREIFELTAFAYGPDQDSAIRRRLVAAFDHFVDVSDEPDDEAIAKLAAARDIDIAISMNGYTRGGRPMIHAFRPAPVQVNFQGYPGTLAAEYIDYLIADRHVIPLGDERFYVEQVVRMPRTYQPTDNKAEIASQPPTRAEESLPEKAFVFMGYNITQKISPLTFDSWMRILRRTPGSVLWVQGRTEQAMHNLSREAAARGVDPNRLVFTRRTPSRADHIARHRLADLFLDTLPYNAHSTASDALWAGLPVITLRGETFPGRVCAGLVGEAGFNELIADSRQAYEDLAVALHDDRARLADLRRRVEERAPRSGLFDTAGYARDLGRAFKVMFERSQAGQSPQAFDLL